jgi:hypothetical protein
LIIVSFLINPLMFNYLNGTASHAVRLQKMILDLQKGFESQGAKIESGYGYLEDEKK